jgi:hypothetical protein
MTRQPTKRHVAKSSRSLSHQLRNRVRQIAHDRTIRLSQIRRDQARRSASRSVAPPILPSSTTPITTIPIFNSTQASISTSLPASRQIIRARPLPVGRRPLIVGKSYLLDIGKCDIECPNCFALHWMGELSSKGTQRHPSFHTCCEDGSIHLPPLMDAPPYLQHLLSRATAGIFFSLHSIDYADV